MLLGPQKEIVTAAIIKMASTTVVHSFDGNLRVKTIEKEGSLIQFFDK